MARYPQTDDGERRTSGLRVQLTPRERADLEAAAKKAGLPLSRFVRASCFHPRTIQAEPQANRLSEARALVRQLAAIGNNLNQLTRVANTLGELPTSSELLAVVDLVKDAIRQVIAL